jgi:hypothetical protein
VDVRPVDPHEPEDIERALSRFARDTKGGLIVTSSRLARVHRELIITLAARYPLPAIYAFRVYVTGGGLAFYGPDAVEPYRRAAAYVNRILKEEASGSPSASADQIRTGHQSSDRQGDRPRSAADAACPRRRGNRMIRRRQFITLLDGAAVAYPVGARGQQTGKLPTIGFLGADASAFTPWTAALVARLRELGWIEGRTIAIEYRWSLRRDRSRVCPPESRCHCHCRKRRPLGKAGDSSYPDCLCGGH